MIIGVTVLILVSCGTLLGWRSLRARRLIAAFCTIEAAPQTVSPQHAQIVDALALLAVDDVTAQRMEASAQAWVPAQLAAHDPNEPMKPIFALMDTIRQSSLVLTGLEQAVLNAPALSPAVEQLTLLTYSALVPADLEAAVGRIFADIANHTGAAILKEGAAQSVQQIVEKLQHTILEQIGGQLVDPLALTEHLNHFAMEHIITGPAVFDYVANHGEAVKIGIDFTAHLFHLPDLAGIVANHSVDAIHAASELFAQHGLSVGQAATEQFLHQNADAVFTQLHDAAAQHASHSLFGGFPIISGIFIGVRQFKLYRQGDVDAGTASKNWAIDIGARFTGGQIGAVIGTAIFPGVGTVVGGIVGAVIFSILGTNIKEQDLRAAEEQVRSVSSQVQTSIHQYETSALPRVASTLQTTHAQYRQAIGHAPRLDTHMPTPARMQVQRLHHHAARNLARAQRTVRAVKGIGQGGWFDHPFLTNVGLTARANAVEARLQRAATALPTEVTVRHKPFLALNDLAVSARDYAPQHRQRRYWAMWKRALHHMQGTMPTYRHDLTQWTKTSLQAYGTAMQALVPVLNEEVDGFTQVITPLLERLQVAVDSAKTEARKLGKIKH